MHIGTASPITAGQPNRNPRTSATPINANGNIEAANATGILS